MADRRMDNGRDDARSSQRSDVSPNGPGAPGGTEAPRRADVAPPGSRERAESDVTGYSPNRDEDPSLRQGRFHRAAAMRLAQPRISRDVATGMGSGTGMGMGGMGMGAGLDTRSGPLSTEEQGDVRGRSAGSGGYLQGPYGRDDRDDRSATGMGGGQVRMGEQDTRYSLELRRDTGGENYRPWDRTGFGGEERQLREDRGQYSSRQGPGNVGQYGTQGQYGGQGPYSGERYDPLLGMGQASPGQPGMGVNMGQSTMYTARGADVGGARPSGVGVGPPVRRRWQREPLTAREIMTRGVKTVRRDSSLREVAQLMKDEDCGVVPIVDERGILVGIVTDRDLVIRAFTGGKTPDQLLAGDVMTDDVECVHPDEDIHSIIELMGKKQIRRIPVVERDDRVIGIISMGDIANRADYDDELQEALDRISSKRSFWSRLT
ncbi:MAG: CBS domain-containing protein [Myxococcaceae bacterium]|nr:CBS domain-containing protein [Myxococcaceae bacterium]